MNINPGNTSETQTMLPIEKEFLDKYNMNGQNIIVCTDTECVELYKYGE